MVEEFATVQEYSVEYISWNGERRFLALTYKYTSGSPHFIEKGHMEPAPVDEGTLYRIQSVVPHALDSLGIKYGASHTELKVAKDGSIRIIEVGGRMGGNFTGSHLVELSTGIDFVKAVIEVAMGVKPQIEPRCQRVAAVRSIFGEADVKVFREIDG